MHRLLSWSAFEPAQGWHAEAIDSADGAQVTALLGPEQPAQFTQAIPSWSAETLSDTWIELQLRARCARGWTDFYRIAQWDSLPAQSARRSFEDAPDAYGCVSTDTLVLREVADHVQPRVLLCARGAAQPRLRALWLALSLPEARQGSPAPRATPVLAIPPRAQLAYPEGWRLCSPSVVAMLLAYWQARLGAEWLAAFADSSAVAEVVAPQVYDPVYDGYGNWGFNTAFAASQGLDAYVVRMGSLAEVVPWIEAGVPVAISASWGAGELARAPIPASDGHLLIVAGFDAQGGVIVADPRGEDAHKVPRVYDAAQLEAAWQRKSGGAAYLVHPHAWPRPALP